MNTKPGLVLELQRTRLDLINAQRAFELQGSQLREKSRTIEALALKLRAILDVGFQNRLDRPGKRAIHVEYDLNLFRKMDPATRERIIHDELMAIKHEFLRDVQ